jgi:hypothetical protein
MKRDTCNNEDLLQLHRDNKARIVANEIVISELIRRIISLEKYLGVEANFVPPSNSGFVHTRIKAVKE